jgi:hypothetical protein
MLEKDYGAFDGTSWVLRVPQRDGFRVERCVGAPATGRESHASLANGASCSALSAWLDEVAPHARQGGVGVAGLRQSRGPGG